jgi:hypothetical protein
MVDQELLLCNEYIVAENGILKAKLKTPLRFADVERVTCAEIAHRPAAISTSPGPPNRSCISLITVRRDKGKLLAPGSTSRFSGPDGLAPY